MTSTTVTSGSPIEPPRKDIGFPEFVALMAAIMSVNALAIDTMMPALPDIGHAVGIPTENGRQWIITAYLLGFGCAQIFYGPIADRFGRKGVMLAGMMGYVIFSAMAAMATSFETLMIARALEGAGASAGRVLSISIIRDRYAGRQMARVMSLSFMVFLAVPILAPSLGQVIMLFAPWRWIFWLLAIYGVVVTAWIGLRLPETIHAEDRVSLSAANVANAFKLVLTNRIAMGYMLAMSVVMGGLFGFINSAQQIFVDVFGEGKMFTLIFIPIAGSIAVASLLNARVVGRLGMRVVSHAALVGFVIFAAIHVIVALTGYETIWSFAILQSGQTFCFGLMSSNFGAIAMEPMGHVAGTAASVQGILTTLGGALLGILISQQFNGSTVPLTIGFLGLGIVALAIVAVTEKGRLFHASVVPAPASTP